MKTTITNEQITALRTEAAAHGDPAMVEICDLALAGDDEARVTCGRSMIGAVYVALVGDDGQRPVVWGLGSGPDVDAAGDAAAADAEDSNDDVDVSALVPMVVTGAIARRILAGEVSCESLGIA